MDNNQSLAEYESWYFPPLIEDALSTFNESTPEIIEDVLIEPDEAEQLRQQLQAKEALLDEKINYLDAMALKLSEQFVEAEALLLKNTVHLIKKTVHKLILKELSVDADTINTMLNHSMETISSNEHPCVIYVSKSDMKHTENNIFLSHVQFKVNELLNPGDFMIENAFFSLEAILEKRINRLFDWVDMQ